MSECPECGMQSPSHKMSCDTAFHPERWSEDVDLDVVDEDWLVGISCNPNEPEECESCQ